MIFSPQNEAGAPQWRPTVILIDADFVGRVVFNLTVQLETMLQRPLPRAQVATWLDCLALDGGLQPGDHQVQALFIHSKDKERMEQFEPSHFADELDAKAFRDGLGEFELASFPVEERMTTRADFYVEAVETLLSASSVERLLLVPDVDEYGAALKPVLAREKEKDITLFAPAPQVGFHQKQEILTYSLLAALGVRGEELQ